MAWPRRHPALALSRTRASAPTNSRNLLSRSSTRVRPCARTLTHRRNLTHIHTHVGVPLCTHTLVLLCNLTFAHVYDGVPACSHTRIRANLPTRSLAPPQAPTQLHSRTYVCVGVLAHRSRQIVLRATQTFHSLTSAANRENVLGASRRNAFMKPIYGFSGLTSPP